MRGLTFSEESCETNHPQDRVGQSHSARRSTRHHLKRISVTMDVHSLASTSVWYSPAAAASAIASKGARTESRQPLTIPGHQGTDEIAMHHRQVWAIRGRKGSATGRTARSPKQRQSPTLGSQDRKAGEKPEIATVCAKPQLIEAHLISSKNSIRFGAGCALGIKWLTLGADLKSP